MEGKSRSRGKKRKTRKTDLTLRFKRAKQFFMHLMVTNGQGIRSAPCQDPLLQICNNSRGVGRVGGSVQCHLTYCYKSKHTPTQNKDSLNVT